MNRDFEEQLRMALTREPAPSDFVNNVLARTTRSNVIPWWKRRAAVTAIAAGTAIAAILPTAIVQHRRHEEAVEAHRQLLEALRITHNKLVWTRHKLERKHS